MLQTETLCNLIDPKNPDLLKELGGVDGIVKQLEADSTSGLSSDQVLVNKQVFGANEFPEPISKTFLQFVWNAIQDKTLLVLMAAAAVELAAGIYKTIVDGDEVALIDGVAILVAVIVIVMIGSIMDYRKQTQFRTLNDFGRSLQEVKVLRDGVICSIQSSEIVVGDILSLQTGDVLQADGLLIHGHEISTDESTMTGEPHAVKKDLEKDPFLLSGTKVLNGVGSMIVIATGVRSLNGKSLLALELEPQETPLQRKLGVIADWIAKFAIWGATAFFLILVIFYCILNSSTLSEKGTSVLTDLVKLFIIAVTIVVIAVPEGLPLAVTLSLAQATLKMLKDNNLVRNLSSCETMGNATTICSDKTGTLTLNKMKIVKGMIGNKDFESANMKTKITSISSEYSAIFPLLANSLNVNSTAEFVKGRDGSLALKGSKTEIAILDFTQDAGYPFEQDRQRSEIIEIEPFSSEVKRMACVVKVDIPGASSAFGYSKDVKWIYVKGASEIIIDLCSKMISDNSEIVDISPDKRNELKQFVASMAELTLRTIACACLPLDKDSPHLNSEGKIIVDGLTLLGVFGIEDPLRPEVTQAVTSCQRSGIVVRMVTGDSMPTAKAIARSCGILSADGLAMEGPEFRKLTEPEMNKILPKLQVLARSSPLDKQILVKNLKRLGETVCVTGDGTNDAPALVAADVGFSMGIAGTEVAKEASDIILMDDNFASLVKAVMWGRSVYDSIRKFLQFQLSVNCSAVVIAFFSSLYTTVTGEKNPKSVLTALQLLWVNLIMDTFAALALASDDPTPELLTRKPSRKSESIINADMYRMIFSQAFYQIVVCFLLYFLMPPYINAPATKLKTESGVDLITTTVIFNAYIWCQIFSELNSRSISRDINVFRGILKNRMFIGIFVLTVVMQIIIVQFGGTIFMTDPQGLSLPLWGLSVGIGAGSLLVGFLVRVLPPFYIPAFLIADYETETEQPAVIEVSTALKDNEKEAFPARTPTHATLLWEKAIRGTRMQIKVVKAFQAPSRYSSSFEYNPDRYPRRSVNNSWLLADPRKLEAARRAQARSQTQNTERVLTSNSGKSSMEFTRTQN